MDPTRLWQQLWQQWYAASLRALQPGASSAVPSGPGPADAFADPWGLAAQWFAAAGTAPPPSFAAPGASAMPNPLDPTALWQWWLNSILSALPGAAPPPAAPAADPQAWLARWQESLRAGTSPPPSGSELPPPPVAWTAFRQWYDASSGAWAKALDELVSSPAFAEAAGKVLDGYASYIAVLRRSSEQFARALQLPTRADIARVAGLVVALEEKVDRIELAQETAADRALDAAHEPPASAAALAALDTRLTRLEAKLDRLLAVMEHMEHTERTERTQSGGGNGKVGSRREERTSSTASPSIASTASGAAASNGSAPRTHKSTTTTRAARAARGRRTSSNPRTPPAP